VNAFAWLAERTSANSTKNFKRAGIEFILFLFIALNDGRGKGYQWVGNQVFRLGLRKE
jgi:hypothetical protein